MPEKAVKRRLQDCDAALASDDGPIFATVAKLVQALKRSIPEGTQNAERRNEAPRDAVNCSAGPSTTRRSKKAVAALTRTATSQTSTAPRAAASSCQRLR